MDLKGSLVDTHLKIYPSENFISFIQTIPLNNNVPENIQKFFKNTKGGLEVNKKQNDIKEASNNIMLTNIDIENLTRIKEKVKKNKSDESPEESDKASVISKDVSETKEVSDNKDVSNTKDTSTSKEAQDKSLDSASDAPLTKSFEEIQPEREGPFLYTSDIVWLYTYLEKRRKTEKDIPYLHELFEGTDIDTPKNTVMKRNPVLEARCVKLRAQQEAREYRKMTRSVDNVRMRFPDDSISYQLKQINRQLIAIGQFIISIFAGFLFGFKGVEWMIGPLDFGFKLLLGVMCALIIALAEIYFLAKKLNEELNVPETVQLGGPPQFVDKKTYAFEPRANKEPSVAQKEPAVANKEHQD